MSYTLKHSFVKQPLEAVYLSEDVSKDIKKNMSNLIDKSTRDFVDHDPESRRKLLDAIEVITKVSPLLTEVEHTNYFKWAIQAYLSGSAIIDLKFDNPDEDDIRGKLEAFDSFRRTKTPLPDSIKQDKQFKNADEEWYVTKYSFSDLQRLKDLVDQGEVKAEDASDDDVEANLLKALNMGDSAQGSNKEKLKLLGAILKKQTVSTAMSEYSKLVYQDDQNKIYLIKGAPSLGPTSGPDDLKYAGIAWHDLSKGSPWCVGTGDYAVNQWGPKYLANSDVLICRRNGEPFFSLQYEGRLLLRNTEPGAGDTNDVLKKGLNEIPMGEFTLITIDLASVHRLSEPKKVVAEFLIDIYPRLDLSESATFGSKKLLLISKEENNQKNIADVLYQEVRNMGYDSLKSYALDVYPAFLAFYYNYINNRYSFGDSVSEKRKVPVPGVSEYCSDRAWHSLTQITGDAPFIYLMSVIFRFKDIIEQDILDKNSPNLATVYVLALKNLPAEPEIKQLKHTEEFIDYLF